MFPFSLRKHLLSLEKKLCDTHWAHFISVPVLWGKYGCPFTDVGTVAEKSTSSSQANLIRKSQDFNRCSKPYTWPLTLSPKEESSTVGGRRNLLVLGEHYLASNGTTRCAFLQVTHSCWTQALRSQEISVWELKRASKLRKRGNQSLFQAKQLNNEVC